MAKLRSLDSLSLKQLERFGLDDSGGLTSPKSAEKFLKTVGIALRYWRTEGLPLASLYQAAWGKTDFPPKKGKGEPGKINAREEAQRKAIELTNHLLETHQGIEVNVIANRIALLHRDLVPALYTLVRRHRPVTELSDLSVTGRKVFQWMETTQEVTAGTVRKFLGIVASDLNNDPAYKVLAELQSVMLVDRGPFVIREKGIAYLSKEGYPYHCFHLAHQDLVRAAAKLNPEEAARNFLYSYFRGAIRVSVKKLFSMFKGFLSRMELQMAIEMLVKKKELLTEKIGRDTFVVFNLKS